MPTAEQKQTVSAYLYAILCNREKGPNRPVYEEISKKIWLLLEVPQDGLQRREVFYSCLHYA